MSWSGSGWPSGWTPGRRSRPSRARPVAIRRRCPTGSRKHGLASAHAPRHTARGGDRPRPARRGRRLRALGPRHGRGLRSQPDDHPALAAPTSASRLARMTRSAARPRGRGRRDKARELPCQRHGLTRHVRPRDGFRCARCGPPTSRTGAAASSGSSSRRPAERATYAVTSACIAALQFHHIDPRDEGFALSREGVTRSLARARTEAAKCVLLCANCHAEVEGGFDRASPKIDRSAAPILPSAARQSGVAQSAEHSTVNRRVVGSSPTPGARQWHHERPARRASVLP